MRCRHCGSELALPFLDLGSAPPSNAYLTDLNLLEPEVWYPLRLLVCTSCWLVQTEDYTAREALFTDDYLYFSSISSSWLAHSERYAQDMIRRFNLQSDSCVVEIAANDGYLLQYFKASGIPCYGVEPTASTAAVAREKGIEVIEAFFGNELADKLVVAERQADLIVANNVLAHVPDINDFVAGFSKLLNSNGVATFEFPHFINLERENQFDTVYHEHYSYLSLTTVNIIFSKNGLSVFDVQELPTHGGSLRVFAQRMDTGTRSISQNVSRLLGKEDKLGIKDVRFYRKFQSKAEKVKNDILEFLIKSKKKKQTVAGYGSAAKGNTLLNFAGVRTDLLPFIADRNPAKQGRFTPGTRIPIVDEAHLANDRPDWILILPWNLRTEIMQQLDYARVWGAGFVTAVPNLQVTKGPRE